MTDLTVNIDKTINAPIEEVFDAWLNPEMLSKFIMPMQGMVEPEVKNEARKGGKFTIIMQVGNEKLPHTGEYLEVNRPEKLVFTWLSHSSVDNSVVTLLFNKVDNDSTQVSLSHVKFIDEQARSNHEGGWTNILDKLAEVMSETVKS